MACRHCWIAPAFNQEDRSEKALPYDIFVGIINEAMNLGLHSVKLTGGEPLIHPDILRIFQYIRDHDLGLTIESNGVAVTPHIAELITSCRSHFISVSIDGLKESHEWMRGVNGSFERVTAGMRTLVKAGIHPQVIMAVAQQNKHDIADLAQYAESLGAGSVKFNFVTPTARGERMEREGGTVPVEEQIHLAGWIQHELQDQVKIPLLTNLPFAFSPLSTLFGPDGNCGRCGIFSILGVLYDGTYALCGIGTSVPDLCFGKAGTDKLKDVWEETPVLNEIRAHLPRDLKGICSRCLVKNVCLGQCVANNYYVNRDLLAGHKFCEDVLAAGMFPVSRLADVPVR